jgi:hypothetical protein
LGNKRKDIIPTREIFSNLPDGFFDGGQEEKDVDQYFEEFYDFDDIGHE